MFLLVVLVCVIFGWYLEGARRKAQFKLPPIYPGALPILGHAHILGLWTQDSTHLWLVAKKMAEVVTNIGGVARLFLGPSDYYIITDPEDMVTAANACLDKNYCYEFAKCWLGNGLLTGKDVIWKRHRKLVSPAFNQHILDSFISIFNMQSKTLVKEFEAELGKGYFQHFTYLDRAALESIYRTAIGIDVENNNKLDKEAFVKAENTLLNVIAKRFQSTWMHFEFLFQFCSLKKEQDEAVKVINDTYNVVMDMKKSSANKIEHEGTKHGSFLDLLLKQAADGSLTNQEVWEEVNTIIVAGHDTVATALTFLLMALGSYPDVQEKVLDEIKEVFQDRSRDVEKTDLTQLVYLEAVIKETLRMYPLGVGVIRNATEDVKLKNYTMPAGTNCVLLMCGLHQHPVWGDDRDKFRPERWFENSPAINNAFAGFGVGKRNCLGKTYAMMFLKTTVVHVLQRYRITSDISKLQLKLEVLLKAASGDVIALEERNY